MNKDIKGASSTDTEPTFVNLLLLPTILGFLVSSAIAVAVSHDTAYFYVIGFDFFSILTTSDLIKSIAQWMPPILGIFFLIFILHRNSPPRTPYFDTYVNHGLLSKAGVKSLLSIIMREKLFSAIGLLFILYLLTSRAWYVSVSFFIFMIFMYYTSRKLSLAYNDAGNKIVKSKYFSSCIYLIYIAVGGLIFGFIDAHQDLNKKSPAYIVRADKLDFPIVIIVRAGEKGLIIKQNDRIAFLPWDNIKLFERINTKTADRSILEGIYNWFTEKPFSPP